MFSFNTRNEKTASLAPSNGNKICTEQNYPILSNPIQRLVVDSYLTDVYESSIDMLI